MVELPPVVYEQRCSVGKIRHQLHPAVVTRVTNETLIPISPRIRERLWSLDNGKSARVSRCLKGWMGSFSSDKTSMSGELIAS